MKRGYHGYLLEGQSYTPIQILAIIIPRMDFLTRLKKLGPILLETFNTIREALIAAKLATITGTPVIVSFVPDSIGRILSGESLTEAASQLLPLGVVALGVNCGPATSLAESLAELRAVCGPDFPLIAYGNIGYPDENVGWVNTDAEDPVVYCQHAADWPVRIMGGCCGTTPAHISQLKVALRA